MAWMHAGYMAMPDDASRLAEARRHHAELQAAMGPDVSRGSASIGHATLEAAIARVTQDIQRLEGRVGTLGLRPGFARW